VLSASVKPWVKVGGNLFNRAQTNCVRQEPIEALPESKAGNGAVGFENRSLSHSVHARIGARGANNGSWRLQHLGNSLLKMLLYRRSIVLPLPPTQAGAIVLDNELQRALRIRS